MKARQAVGCVLRHTREAQHLTLRQVSQRACISLAHLSETERGVKEISSELLETLCGTLDLELADLFAQASEQLRTPV